MSAAITTEQPRLSLNHLRDIAGANGTFTQVINRIASQLGLDPNDLSSAATHALRTNDTKATFDVRNFLKEFHLPEESQVKIDQLPTDEELKGLLSADGQDRSKAISAFALKYNIDKTQLSQDIAPCKQEGDGALANLRGRIFERLGLDAEGNIVVKTEAHPEPVEALEEMDATGAFTGSAPVSESLVETNSGVGFNLEETNDFEFPRDNSAPEVSNKTMAERVIDALFVDPSAAEFRKLLLIEGLVQGSVEGIIAPVQEARFSLIGLLTTHPLTKDIFGTPDDLIATFGNPASESWRGMDGGQRGGGFLLYATRMITEECAKRVEQLTKNLILRQPTYNSLLQTLRRDIGLLNGFSESESTINDVATDDEFGKFFNGNKDLAMFSDTVADSSEISILTFFKKIARDTVLEADLAAVQEKISALIHNGELSSTQILKLLNGEASIDDKNVLGQINDFCDKYFGSEKDFGERVYVLRNILSEKAMEFLLTEPIKQHTPIWKRALTPLGAIKLGQEFKKTTAALGISLATLGYLARSGLETTPPHLVSQAQVIVPENPQAPESTITPQPAPVAEVKTPTSPKLPENNQVCPAPLRADGLGLGELVEITFDMPTGKKGTMEIPKDFLQAFQIENQREKENLAQWFYKAVLEYEVFNKGYKREDILIKLCAAARQGRLLIQADPKAQEVAYNPKTNILSIPYETSRPLLSPDKGWTMAHNALKGPVANITIQYFADKGLFQFTASSSPK